ncbi:hypothetical protein [Lysobacter antibioticus]|uniref:hypothetical protein n=1 Tax=Lysobacter antibioticus TaxID=84531 RepID=UPI0013788836|nr:hypothetical protein [Lysobacter antibioticus]
MSAIHPFHGAVAATVKRSAGSPVPAAVQASLMLAGARARPWPRCLPLSRSPAALAAGAAASSDDRAAAIATEWSRT